jgi:hypothetical protein
MDAIVGKLLSIPPRRPSREQVRSQPKCLQVRTSRIADGFPRCENLLFRPGTYVAFNNGRGLKQPSSGGTVMKRLGIISAGDLASLWSACLPIAPLPSGKDRYHEI